MHRVKNLNFSMRLPELHSIFHVLFLPVDLHPHTGTLTGIEQVIYRWKAAVNTQLSRVDRYFILATILKLFHVIWETTGSSVLPLSRNRFFENAPREELELLGVST